VTNPSDIPLVLFVYRRPEVLRRALECFRADKVPMLHVFSDGPRDESVADEVFAVRQIIRSIDWCDWVLEESQVNLGLGVSVKRGVTVALERYGMAIFFEDDLVSVPGTYKYLVSALCKYKDEPRVMSVTGWTHPNIVPDGIGVSPYFDGKAECWAWGTWARAWEGMEESALQIMDCCVKRSCDIEKYGTDMPKMAAEAEAKNLWAVGWWYHHMRLDGLCLRPPWSLVDQVCWDQDISTTSTPEMMAWANPPLRECPPIPTEWPTIVENSNCSNRWRTAIDG
jgi:hypothetical protein